MSLAACIRRCPATTPLAVIGVLALPDKALQDRLLGFLGLQEQRILVVPAQHEQDPGTCADTADTDDLTGGMNIVEVLQQVTPVGLQRAPIGPDQAAQFPFDSDSFPPVRQQVLDRSYQRRVRNDPALAGDLMGQLGERLHAVPGPGLGKVRLSFGALFGAGFRLELREQLPSLDVGIPDVEVPHPGGLFQPCPVLLDPGQHDLPPLGGREPAVPAGDLEARGSRLTSHSHGPGAVSSKSLMSNINCRSGEANSPKFDKCASPQIWTFKPDRGVAAKSAAMINAAPR
jgi:hypothetical protein